MYKHECINIHIHMYKKVYAHASVCMHTSACASVYVQHGWMDGWMGGWTDIVYMKINIYIYICGAICFKSVNVL